MKSTCARVVSEIKRRILRTFAGVEFVGITRHEDGTRSVTFITYDDNADDVLESVEDLLDDDDAGVKVVVVPHE